MSAIANPDNIAFDNAGNLWIATDGQPGTLEYNDGFFAVPVAGESRGHLRQFFSSVAGSEVCGPEFTPDNTAVFLAIQHPGEGGTFDEPVSTWPDGDVPPRPSVIVIQGNAGDVIGMGAATDGAEAEPTALPQTGDDGILPAAGLLAAAGFAAAAAGAFLRRRGRNMGNEGDA